MQETKIEVAFHVNIILGRIIENEVYAKPYSAVCVYMVDERDEGYINN